MKVFAGDNSKPAADASYRNLSWENFHVDQGYDIGIKIGRNKEIGIIDSWGPLFRVSFDLIFHSLRLDDDRFSVLEFKFGDFFFPGIFLHWSWSHWSWLLEVQQYFQDQTYKVELNVEINKWYNIVIEQNSDNGKVKK